MTAHARLAVASREGDRVTTLELFFDLAFVFAFTQLSRLMAQEHDASGVVKALVILALLAWALNAGSRHLKRYRREGVNLERIIRDHSGREDLRNHVRTQAAVLCDIAEGLSAGSASVLVPTLLISNDQLLVDQPLPLAAIIDGLADNHVPVHTQQLRALRTDASKST